MNSEKIKKILHNSALRVIVVCVLAFLLLLAVWKVFFREKGGNASGYEPTPLEHRLSLLLEEIEGVEEATVMIGEEDGVAASAVVIIKGDVGLVTRSRVVDATANALNIARREILVYPADS